MYKTNYVNTDRQTDSQPDTEAALDNDEPYQLNYYACIYLAANHFHRYYGLVVKVLLL